MLVTLIVVAAIAVPVIMTQGPSPAAFIRRLLKENTTVDVVAPDSGGDATALVVRDPAVYEKILRNGDLGLAESFMDGDWESKDLEGTLSRLHSGKDNLMRAIRGQSLTFFAMGIRTFIRDFFRNNTLESSKKNITMHYDVGNDLYSRMLGKHMQYTCAYFHKPGMSLDEAQFAKMELIAKKLNLREGLTVLDIGCGFGSMAHHLATRYKVRVVGVTLSAEQKRYAEEHFGHPDVEIRLQDYRHTQGQFDRVYSVGMFEHVGRRNYATYFNKCHELLKSDGIMLLHTIGIHERGGSHNAFVDKYIFPEGELPHASNLTEDFVDRWHLEDWQNFGLSYAKTLRAWRENIGDWNGLDQYDGRFRRMWDFYLQGFAATFSSRHLCLWQVVYTKWGGGREDDCHHIRS